LLYKKKILPSFLISKRCIINDTSRFLGHKKGLDKIGSIIFRVDGNFPPTLF